jgi:formate dehydrogenase subunit delta
METRDTVRMANQIADFFKGYGHDDAVKEIADHINRFWEPRMRKHLFDLLGKGGDGLSPLVKDASALVRKPGSSSVHIDEPADHETGLPREAHEA